MLTVAAASLPAGAAGRGDRSVAAGAIGFQGESGLLSDIDSRPGSVRPTAVQRARVPDGARVTWSRFGTPHSIFAPGGALATGLPRRPEAAARTWLEANADLFGLSPAASRRLELVASSPIGGGRAVLFRQRAGDLIVAPEGMVVVGVAGRRIVHVSSSLVGDVSAPTAPTLALEEAARAAARNAGWAVSDVSRAGSAGGWTRLRIGRLSGSQLGRLVATPIPGAETRAAYEIYLMDTRRSEGYRYFIDAHTGEVLIRWREVDFAGEPKWEVFPAYPPLDYSSEDTRQTWCWVPAEGCDLVMSTTLSRPPAARVPWDVNPRINSPTFTSFGNNARTTEKWLIPVGSASVGGVSTGPTVGVVPNTPRPGRDYVYPWTNRWYEERCNPATAYLPPQLNDLDAAIANLFAMHNRMHDWSYWLGFTEVTWNGQDSNFGNVGPDRRENDPERGNAQAGALLGGFPAFLSRDNANQFTPPDGTQPVTNMFLWQPVARAWYGPCVDGDFDMSVIAHEYTHMISNRMVAGPDQRLVGLQANAMGESWSDLVAAEYLNEYRFVPIAGENPFAVGAYVTGDHEAGIRNYGMNRSPLNYSDVGYDITGPQVHADGEIWSAVNFDIRQAMNARYDAAFPSTDPTLQRRCADGELPVQQCPGNRRWIQLVFDAWLLMPPSGDVSMVQARDAMLAADRIRFRGANQDLLWNAFARRGLGSGASSKFGSNDDEPRPSFESPHEKEGTLRFRPVDAAGNPISGAELYVGHYEARVTPVADTDPRTQRADTVSMVAGTYDFVAKARGYGMHRFTRAVSAGENSTLGITLPRNLASVYNGARATGDGVNHQHLIDDTEATNWGSLERDVQGSQVTVRLAPTAPSHLVDRVQVSALLRPPNAENPNDPAAQNRFSALRQFEILTCLAGGTVRCEQDGDFSLIYTSPPDAFPSIRPRPRAPELILRSFDVPDTRATHVRLRVVTNQCTGAPDYQGEQDDDPLNDTDCDEAVVSITTVTSPQDQIVRAAELQVFAA